MSTQNTKNDNNTMEHEYPKRRRIYELCKNCGERKEAHREFNDGNSVYSFYVCDNFELLLDIDNEYSTTYTFK